jgi:ribosome-binding protein aMBF1 (putative translation factor)
MDERNNLKVILPFKKGDRFGRFFYFPGSLLKNIKKEVLSMLTGDVIRLLRTTHKLSQAEFSRKTKISQPMVSYLERGVYEITPKVEKRIKKAFGLNSAMIATLQAVQTVIIEERSDNDGID